jgi:hypothetical protein
VAKNKGSKGDKPTTHERVSKGLDRFEKALDKVTRHTDRLGR